MNTLIYRLIFFSSIILFFTALTFLIRLLMRKMNQKIWQNNVVEKTAYYYPHLFMLTILFVIVSSLLGRHHWLTQLSITLSFILFILGVALLLASPFVFAVYSGHQFLVKISPKKTPNPTERRKVLKLTASAAPLLLLSCSTKGFVNTFSKVRTPEIPFYFAHLPDSLKNFRILHLSDLHLGYYFNLPDLEQLVKSVSHQLFDLVLITGDCADDVDLLPEALHLINQIPARLPKFFTLGNHEYFRNLPRTLRIIEKSDIQLLRNESVILHFKNTKIRLIGLDDPVFMGREIHSFLKTFFTVATQKSTAQAFNLALSHRPQALDLAPTFQVDLILSGHTHGGQIGFNGRSIFENWGIHKYLWGKYQKDQSQLYTSSGVGAWFPFRLGCPPEAPIIVLKKDSSF